MGPNLTTSQSHLPTQAEEWLEYLGTVRGYSQLTLRAYRSDLVQLVTFLSKRGTPVDFASLEPRMLYQWATHLGERYAPATVRRKLDTLSSLMRHLCNLGLADSNPLATIARPKRKRQIPDPPTASEGQQLLAACRTNRERSVIAVLLFCGLRKSEVIGLDCGDLAADLSQLRVRHAKGGDERVVPLCEEARTILKAYLEVIPDTSGALVLNKAGKRIGSTSLQRLFKRLLRRADLVERGLTIHSCRHAFASQLLKAGVNLRSVQLLLGHRSIASTEQYLHVTADDQQDAVDRLDRAFAQPNPAQMNQTEVGQPHAGTEGGSE